MIEEKKDNKNLIIGVLIGLVIALSLALVYFMFIRNDETKTNDNGGTKGNENVVPTATPLKTPTQDNNTNGIVELEKFSVNNTSKSISLKNGIITIKSSDGSLYANNKKVYTSDAVGDGDVLYEIYTNPSLDYILVSDHSKGECVSNVSGAINSKGELVELEYNYLTEEHEASSCVVSIYLKDGKTVVKKSGKDSDTNKQFEEKIEVTLKTANNETKIDNSTELIDYILNQKITKIEINREDCDNNDYRTVKLDTNKLKKILNTLNNYKLTKEIVEGAGASCVDSLSIQYSKGKNSYNIEILNDLIWIDKDYDLEKILDKKCDKLSSKTCKNDQCMTQYNLNKKLSFDEYLK